MELEAGFAGGWGVGDRPGQPPPGLSHLELRLGALAENRAGCAGQVSPLELLLTGSGLGSDILRGEPEQEIGQELPP